MPKGNGVPIVEAIPMLADALAYYDVNDVERWFERSQRMTGRYPTIWPSTIEDVRTFRKVPNEPFRKEWEVARRQLIMGMPDKSDIGQGGGDNFHGEPEWCGLFRDELLRIRALPEGFDFRTTKIGPRELTCQRISDYLRSTLGIQASQGAGGIFLPWLMHYEVAEALCKTLGLVPIQVGI